MTIIYWCGRLLWLGLHFALFNVLLVFLDSDSLCYICSLCATWTACSYAMECIASPFTLPGCSRGKMFAGGLYAIGSIALEGLGTILWFQTVQIKYFRFNELLMKHYVSALTLETYHRDWFRFCPAYVSGLDTYAGKEWLLFLKKHDQPWSKILNPQLFGWKIQSITICADWITHWLICI